MRAWHSEFGAAPGAVSLVPFERLLPTLVPHERHTLPAVRADDGPPMACHLVRLKFWRAHSITAAIKGAWDDAVLAHDKVFAEVFKHPLPLTATVHHRGTRIDALPGAARVVRFRWVCGVVRAPDL